MHYICKKIQGSKYLTVISVSEMDILHETLHFMDQCFFNLYQNGPSIFEYTYVLCFTYKKK